MYYPKERRTILQAFPLPPAAVTTFTNIFPLDGCGWSKIRLIFSTTTSAMVTTFADGIYRWIKGITLRTSRGEVLYNNVPGMAMYRFNSLINHSHPWHDPHPAAGGVACAVLDIPFCMPFLNRPEDTILDTGRYSNLELQITTGIVQDFLAAASVAQTAVVTMGIEIESTLAALVEDGTSKPFALPYVSTYPNIATATRLNWDLESSLDLGLFGFFLHFSDVLANAMGAVPFCSPAAGGVDNYTNVTLRDSVRTWINLLPHETFENDREILCPPKKYYFPDVTHIPGWTDQIPTTAVGLYPYFFIQNGSINEVYPTAKKSLINLSFTAIGAVGTQRADLCVFGMRALR